jgi:hypothetical protein
MMISCFCFPSCDVNDDDYYGAHDDDGGVDDDPVH